MPLCKSCEAEIIWATSLASGRPAPFDAKPDPAGLFVIIAGKARRATPGDDQLKRERYTSHFATCPDRAEWRRP